jgi:hypothetical protein
MRRCGLPCHDPGARNLCMQKCPQRRETIERAACSNAQRGQTWLVAAGREASSRDGACMTICRRAYMTGACIAMTTTCSMGLQCHALMLGDKNHDATKTQQSVGLERHPRNFVRRGPRRRCGGVQALRALEPTAFGDGRCVRDRCCVACFRVAVRAHCGAAQSYRAAACLNGAEVNGRIEEKAPPRSHLRPLAALPNKTGPILTHHQLFVAARVQGAARSK